MHIYTHFMNRETESGIKWNTVGTLFFTILQFIINVFLMRLLTPAEFGLFAIINVFFSLISIFFGAGLSSSLIQNTKIYKNHIYSVFWINVILGLILFFFSYTILPHLLEKFYNNLPINIYIKFISINFIFISLNNTPLAILQKKLNFKFINKIKIFSSFCSGIIAICIAYNGGGIWALILQFTISSILVSILLLLKFKTIPKFLFSKKAIADLSTFAIHNTWLKIIHFLAKNFDTMAIGKYIGTYELGFYNKAFNVSRTFLNLTTNQVSNVLFASLARIQDDKNKIKNDIIFIVKNLSIIIYFIYIGFITLSQHMIPIIYGVQWIEMIFYLNILLVGAIFDGLTLTGTVLRAINSTKKLLLIGILCRIIQIILVIITVGYGIKYLVIGVTIGMITNFIIMSILMCLTINIKIFSFFKILIYRLIPFFFIGVLVNRIPIQDFNSNLFLFIFKFFIYILLSFFSIKLFFPETIKSLNRVIRSSINNIKH